MTLMTTPTPAPDQSPLAAAIEQYDARTLITNGTQAQIRLDDQIYTLRITRAGKLILTK
ncbi:hemin uptake protein HemP [Pseudoprimorskyibacter insulae]|uniref:Hemin uptake protein HemP n=1 Tax=Pseudoprimorskyibacter insulae TaxID=1695997 RepID=A0A2R8AUP7_9RHOB|nr:hemin uptake protein HemP [Pseudoprimorskyibacter insulae]SPF79589.1 hypothetical protein PRI8871_01386 [Pseudoprimorskyibacter insulae]